MRGERGVDVLLLNWCPWSLWSRYVWVVGIREWMNWSIYEWPDLYMNELIDLYLWCYFICMLLDCWRFGKGLCCEVQRTLHPVKKRSDEMRWEVMRWWGQVTSSDLWSTDQSLSEQRRMMIYWSSLLMNFPFVEGTLTLLVSVRMNIDGSTYTMIPPSQDYISLIAISKLSLISHDMMHHILLSCIYCKKATLYFDFGS